MKKKIVKIVLTVVSLVRRYWLARGELRAQKRWLALEAIVFFFFQAEAGIRDFHVTGVQTCALPISLCCLGASAQSAVTPLRDSCGTAIEHMFYTGCVSSIRTWTMTASQTATAAPDAPSWVRATDQHELAIDLANGALVCRNARGRLLKSIPKRVRESAAADRLRALLDWLGRHEAECHATVERWMLSSMPVPAAVLAAARPGRARRRPIEHAVVANVGEDGRPSRDASLGFLRGVGDDGRLGIVDLDGETRWLDHAAVSIPHPVLLDDLDELREFAVELSVEQGIQQLLREVHARAARCGPDRRQCAAGRDPDDGEDGEDGAHRGGGGAAAADADPPTAAPRHCRGDALGRVHTVLARVAGQAPCPGPGCLERGSGSDRRSRRSPGRATGRRSPVPSARRPRRPAHARRARPRSRPADC